MTIGKQKPRERVGFEPTVRLPVQRFSSSKVGMLVASVLVRRLAMADSRPTERPQAANDRQMESRNRKMHERTLAVLARHFLTRLTSRYRAIADELAWRRAANRGRSNRAREWIVGAVFVIAIILTGYR